MEVGSSFSIRCKALETSASYVGKEKLGSSLKFDTPGQFTHCLPSLCYSVTEPRGSPYVRNGGANVKCKAHPLDPILSTRDLPPHILVASIGTRNRYSPC